MFEHIEYFPYGELFGHEHSNTQITPYRFTGKEYDEVTGLYYYGARYYDPRTSVWQSVDPILGEYMSGQTNGGVFNPRNLSLFGYTYGNPVNLVDPDGESAGPIYLKGPLAKIDLQSGNSFVDNTVLGAVNTLFNISNSFINSGLNALTAYGDMITPHEAAIESISSGLGPYGKGMGMAVISLGKVSKGIVNIGGKFSNLDKLKLADEVGHHIPQNAFNKTIGLSRGDGPTVGMTKIDHAKTRTFAGRGKGTMNRDKNLNARQRLAKDIKDVRSLFGRKYNKGLQQAIKYAKTLDDFK